MTNYIIYNLNDGTYSYTDSEAFALGALQSEDLIVANVSDWDDDEMAKFDALSFDKKVAHLEGIELIDEIKSELARRPL